MRGWSIPRRGETAPARCCCATAPSPPSTGAGPHRRRGEGVRRIDAGGLVLAPGLVDLRAFLGEPGAEFRETLGTGSQAAAAGGVTTIVCRPDTDPPIDDPAIIDFIKRRARDKAIVNVLPSAALTKGLHGKEITEFGLLLEAGAVAFGDGAKALRNPQVMRRAMIYARDFDALIMNHVEDPDLRGVRRHERGRVRQPQGPAGHSARGRDGDAGARHPARPRHRRALPRGDDLLRRIGRAGAPGQGRRRPHHLRRLDQQPDPERERCRRLPHLLQGLAAAAPLRTSASPWSRRWPRALIDVVVSDHDPQDVETKRQPFAEAADGALGIETLLSAALRMVQAGQIGLSALLAALSTRPADLLGLPCGRLAVGAPADLMLLDLDAPFVVDKRKLKSRAKNSPFDEARLEGIVQATFVGGRVVYEIAAG